jgi:hypothetical protein
MRHQNLTGYPRTIAWLGPGLMDWVQNWCYDLAEPRDPQITRSFGFDFDRAIASADGRYAFVYKARGTKGILLKEGEELREINRSYYHAGTYEYPAAFVTVDDVTYLVHCPLNYCQLDFENVETGELVTNIPGREPSDMFHSRLEVSPAGGYFMSKGWYWHPLDVVRVYDIRACLLNPLLLDGAWELSPDTGAEVSMACFITEQHILLGSSNEESMRDEDDPEVLPPSHLVLWDFQADTFAPALPVPPAVGNLFPLDEKRVWDLYKYPKILSVETGEVLDKLEDVDTGLQNTSIIHHLETVPAIAFNRHTRQIAVKNGDTTTILSAE